MPALFTEDHTPTVLNSGCSLGRHQPDCPALRLEALTSLGTDTHAEAPTETRSPAATGSAAGSSRARTDGFEDLLHTVLEQDAALRPDDPDDPASWPGYRRLSAPLRTLISRPDFDSHASEPFRALLVRVLRYYFVTRQHRLGVTLARPVLRVWTDALGADHPHTLSLANRLAGCLFGLRETAEARALWQDILPRIRRTLGDNHPDALTVSGNLATSLHALGEYEQAQAAHQETLQLSHRALGHDHPATLRTAGNLAASLRHLGDHDAARTLGEDNLRRQRRTQGPDHPDTLAEAEHLALTLHELGAHEAAQDLEADTLQRRRRVLGEDHPDTRRTTPPHTPRP